MAAEVKDRRRSKYIIEKGVCKVKVPEPRQLKSGLWFVQLRLGGESIPISDHDKKRCKQRAQLIKAEYLNGKKVSKASTEPVKTLGDACDNYIANRCNMRSPSTIRGYEYIRKNRFKRAMSADIFKTSQTEWIEFCNEESKICSPKTLKNAWGFISAVLSSEGVQVKVILPQVPVNERPFLDYEQILLFVKAVKGTKVAIPAYLGLHSLRRSEMCALKWKDIDFKQKIIHINGAAVYNEDQKLVQKGQTKNRSSNRYIPIMIDDLYDELKEKRGNPNDLVLNCNPNTIWAQVNRICEKEGLPKIGAHGLRHSFASLAHHLGLPEAVTMEIGGWSDPGTMRKIYRHAGQKDSGKLKNKMAEFFSSSGKGESGDL